ncbi:ATPase, BadF/BadG/BcrA/BcrD type [Candidatus Sulfopaludibacter sp. SbA3]|nr:ATPase, BadF/BadG/BcrA/BcrD type [Candidatus Sulfopaludibacter sp. SbA3]
MRFFLGVDGGQSGTTAVIGDENGRVLGEGEAGPCNHAGAGEGRAKLERAVRTSVRAACESATLDADTIEFAAACFGMSGGPDDKQEILAAILRTERLVVTTDAVTALAGATARGQGIITIAGTGSIAFGRNAAGSTARAGGWGYIFGDEGGAFDLVRQALRAALRMEEGWGPPTSLRTVLLEATGSASANEMLHRFYSDEWPRSRVATLARLVDGAALNADGVAMEIVNRAAMELALLAASVRNQLWKPGESVDVAYIGGVFESAPLRERFRILVEMEEGNRCGPPLHGPAEGALLEAYRAAGIQPELAKR